ncbi:MAG: RNA polymerase sigma factor [Deltaproteobacteria bacterium]
MPPELDLEKEKALILRVRRNERSAFDELVLAYRNRGFAIAYNFTGNPEDAKDVLQEAFIRVYTRIGDFREQSRFSTWFYRVVVNCSLDFLRRRKRVRSKELEPLTDEEGNMLEPVGDIGKPDPLRAQDSRAALEECLAQLPERQRTCFVLRHENELSCAEIARVLHCNVSTVKVHLFRATNALRVKLAAYLRKEV